MTEQSDASSTQQIHLLLSKPVRKIGFAIDANIYVVGKHKDGQTKDVNLDQAPLRKLRAVAGRDFQFLIPEVWRRETVGHLTGISKARLDELRATKSLPAWLSTPELDSACAELKKIAQAADGDAVAQRAWEQFLAATHAVQVETPSDITGKALDRYFGSQPPFGKTENKKNEFPDAIALLSLDRYASDEGYDAIVVITKDDGPLSYCAASSKLIAFRDLGLALAAFDSVDAINYRRELSTRWSDYFGLHFDKLIDPVREAINAPYTHAQHRAWRAFDVDIPDLQYPRVLIRELLEAHLVPFGAFNLPVEVSVWDEGPKASVWGTAHVKVKARLAGEVSAMPRELGHPTRTSFDLPEVVEKVIEVAFIGLVERDANTGELSVTQMMIRNLTVDPVPFRTPADIETAHWA